MQNLNMLSFRTSESEEKSRQTRWMRSLASARDDKKGRGLALLFLSSYNAILRDFFVQFYGDYSFLSAMGFF